MSLEKECAFEARIRNLELESLEKAIFETDHISWTIHEAKVVPAIELKTLKSNTSSNKMHGKSVKNVMISPD